MRQHRNQAIVPRRRFKSGFEGTKKFPDRSALDGAANQGVSGPPGEKLFVGENAMHHRLEGFGRHGIEIRIKSVLIEFFAKFRRPRETGMTAKPFTRVRIPP
jgi:hypothetical protein